MTSQNAKNKWLHPIIWSTALLIFGLFVFRFFRILALDIETFITNVYPVEELPKEWIALARISLQVGAVPVLLLFFADLIYRFPRIKEKSSNPIKVLSPWKRFGIGLASFAAYIPFSAALSLALTTHVAMEMYYWIAWFGRIPPMRTMVYTKVPFLLAPGVLAVGLIMLRGSLSRPRDKSEKRNLALKLLRGVSYASGAVPIAALLVVGIPAWLHAPRAALAPGLMTFETTCGQCHVRARPLFFIKTPAEWRVTVSRMRNFEGAPLTDSSEEKVVAFLTGMRSFPDHWAFTSRCRRCHVASVYGWENRTSEDWRAIINRWERWSPYYYNERIQDQVAAHLAKTRTDDNATLGLEPNLYRRFHKLGKLCSTCHSISREADRYRGADPESLMELIGRMKMKIPPDRAPADLHETASLYRELISDMNRFDRLFPHDRPIIDDSMPWWWRFVEEEPREPSAPGGEPREPPDPGGRY
jgi:hypothetical protein